MVEAISLFLAKVVTVIICAVSLFCRYISLPLCFTQFTRTVVARIKPKVRAIKSQRDFSSTFVHLNDFLLFSNACKCSVYKASRYMLSCNLTYRSFLRSR